MNDFTLEIPNDWFSVKNAYEQAMKNALSGMEDGKKPTPEITLIYSQPVRLLYGRRQGYVEAAEHRIRDLWFDGERAVYIPTTKMNRGYYVPRTNLLAIRVTFKDFAKEWQGVANTIRKNALNVWYADAIEAHLRGETPHIEGTQNYWTIYDKPRLSSFSDLTKGHTLDELKTLALATEEKRWSNHRNGTTQRDRSVSVWLQKDGTWGGSAASEYCGCGNGSYYILISATQAIYAEDD